MSDRRTARKRLGDFGERHAAYLLERHGHTIVARGWHCPDGELDLVTRDGQELVFVEVRTRRGDGYGTPEESIAGRKAARLLRTAEQFLATHPEYCDAIWRIDLVAIVLAPDGTIIRTTHHLNAVTAES